MPALTRPAPIPVADLADEHLLELTREGHHHAFGEPKVT